ncbi:MAG: hypothetical protein AB1801_25225 [Chloroflexota bacterium]
MANLLLLVAGFACPFEWVTLVACFEGQANAAHRREVKNMSGTSVTDICPQCDGEWLITYSDSKPYPQENGECLECGFAYYTIEERLTLEEVNEKRVDFDLEPLKSLKQ